MSKINKLYKDSLIKVVNIVKEYGDNEYLLAQKLKELAINDYEIEECFLTDLNLLEFIVNKYSEIIHYFFNEKLFIRLHFRIMNECSHRTRDMTLEIYYKCITETIYMDMLISDIRIGLEKMKE